MDWSAWWRRAAWLKSRTRRVLASLEAMQTPVFEETHPADYLTRLAASDLGKAYKAIAAQEMAIRPGDAVLDLGCGPGADLPAFAQAAASSGRVTGIDRDPDAVRQATERTAGLPQVEVREGDSTPSASRRAAWTRSTPTGSCSTSKTPGPRSPRHGASYATAARPSSPSPTGTLS
jgi:SAM-dependent methyltransferase